MPNLIAEVAGLQWLDKQTLVWDPVSGATEYHVYRDLVSDLTGLSVPATCRDDLDADPADTELIDDEVPAVGVAHVYRITAEGEDDESTLGLGSCSERPNPELTACP